MLFVSKSAESKYINDINNYKNKTHTSPFHRFYLKPVLIQYIMF